MSMAAEMGAARSGSADISASAMPDVQHAPLPAVAAKVDGVSASARLATASCEEADAAAADPAGPSGSKDAGGMHARVCDAAEPAGADQDAEGAEAPAAGSTPILAYPSLTDLQLVDLTSELTSSWGQLLQPSVLPSLRSLALHTGAGAVLLPQGSLTSLMDLTRLEITGAGVMFMDAGAAADVSSECYAVSTQDFGALVALRELRCDALQWLPGEPTAASSGAAGLPIPHNAAEAVQAAVSAIIQPLATSLPELKQVAVGCSIAGAESDAAAAAWVHGMAHGWAVACNLATGALRASCAIA